jgi:hypothetical protein
MFNLVNAGSTAYVVDGVNNKQLSLVRGLTYAFNVSASGHPFWIKTLAGIGQTNIYSQGVVGNGLATGKLFFTVPATAPSVLYYSCELHTAMTGTLNIFNGMGDLVLFP